MLIWEHQDSQGLSNLSEGTQLSTDRTQTQKAKLLPSGFKNVKLIPQNFYAQAPIYDLCVPSFLIEFYKVFEKYPRSIWQSAGLPQSLPWQNGQKSVS